MTNPKPSDAGPSQIPIPPKRKRRVPCLDEQERRQRKRAMDREAQRSIREKTKTRIADLERTVKMLRNKDGNNVTNSLMSEIDGLRAENQRLKQIIENVRSLVGGGIVLQNGMEGNGQESGKDEGSSSPAATNIVGSNFSELPTPFVNHVAKTCSLTDPNQPVPTEQTASARQPTCLDQPTSIGQPISFNQSTSTRPIELDGMSVMTDTYVLGFQDVNEDTHPSLQLQPLTKDVQEQEDEDEEPSVKIQKETTYMAMLQEIFGPDCRSPSPTILYIGDPLKVPQPTLHTPICPMWTNISEVLGKIFTYRSHGTCSAVAARRPISKPTEAGLLYLGIKNGWDSIPAWVWQYYPALKLFRQADDLAFHRFLKTVRLAVGYKSLKLLTYYLNATKQDLDNVPIWLRPSSSQASTKHPIIIDFFAWPSLRTRFLSHHPLLSRSAALSIDYPRHLRFDWPFSFEDTFFYDHVTGNHVPSPLFEMYAGDLKHWMMEESFYEKFPEMRDDIEGDRMVYAHIEV